MNTLELWGEILKTKAQDISDEDRSKLLAEIEKLSAEDAFSILDFEADGIYGDENLLETTVDYAADQLLVVALLKKTALEKRLEIIQWKNFLAENMPLFGEKDVVEALFHDVPSAARLAAADQSDAEKNYLAAVETDVFKAVVTPIDAGDLVAYYQTHQEEFCVQTGVPILKVRRGYLDVNDGYWYSDNSAENMEFLAQHLDAQKLYDLFSTRIAITDYDGDKPSGVMAVTTLWYCLNFEADQEVTDVVAMLRDRMDGKALALDRENILIGDAWAKALRQPVGVTADRVVEPL